MLERGRERHPLSEQIDKINFKLGCHGQLPPLICSLMAESFIDSEGYRVKPSSFMALMIKEKEEEEAGVESEEKVMKVKKRNKNCRRRV